MHGLRLYARYVGISWRAQLQYRASFLMQTFGTGMLAVIEFFGIWVLFDRFGRVGGWRLEEISVFYGVVNLAWAIAEGVGRGFDDFGSVVKAGDFDRVLLRPRSSALQVLGREMTLRRFGRLLQGAVILGWGWSALHLSFTLSRVSLLLLAIVGGVALFEGLLILQATLAFWTIESLEMMNVLTYGGVTTAQYPLAIYPLWLRRFFTFVVPLACFSYFPLLAVLDRPHDALLAWLSPLFGVLFLFVSLAIWRVGVRRYTSTGS